MLLGAVGCAETAVLVDGSSLLEYEGRMYGGIWGGGFDLDRENLTVIGVATRTNLPGSNGQVYQLFDSNPVYICRSDVAANQGVGWSFTEWKPWATSCDHVVKGRAAAYIRQSSWKNQTSNVVHKYFHTQGGTSSYGLSFGPASITISPTSNQWTAAAFASFSH